MDENFNEMEQQASQRKESVRVALNPYRDQVIEEIAQHVQKMTVFGKDTVDSFAIYIRSLK
jgi:CHASE3 domain sensor protein